MSIFVNYPPAGGNYPPGTVLIPLSDLGLDQILSQIRSQDFNPDVLRELEDSIAKNGLLEALGVIPTRPGSSNVKPVTVVHGVHRLGRIVNLAATLGLFANGVPCLPESYSSLGDLYIKQFNKNAHDEKVHTPNGKDDAISLIGKILQDGTLAPMGGLTWSTSIFAQGKTAQAKLFKEMSDFVNPDKSPLSFPKSRFKATTRRAIVDEIFKTNGAVPLRPVRLYAPDEVKRNLKSGGIIAGYASLPGTVDKGTLVVTMNHNDYHKKVLSVIQKLIELGGTQQRFAARPLRVVVVAYSGKAATDTQLDNFRKSVEKTVGEINEFIAKQCNNKGFMKLVDELYFLPQKQNRTTGNETKLVKGKV
tara:strand:- start:484 stop:1569 length:1086 start_codon:yes stop_codon:yes gene_type:complete